LPSEYLSEDINDIMPVLSRGLDDDFTPGQGVPERLTEVATEVEPPLPSTIHVLATTPEAIDFTTNFSEDSVTTREALSGDSRDNSMDCLG
jgi:hypothetical protein